MGEERGPTAGRLIELVADPGTFRCWDEPVAHPGADPAYTASLARARARTGLDEAVTTGRALIDGVPVALIASEFGFLGGSIGVATAERITRAVERATAARLPVLALPVSGGTRMQEGAAAFLCMVRVTAAVQAHQAAGLPYLTYLRNPTMGGVFASWGTLGHVVLAEPGARLGFLGPRVYEELRGVRLPPGVQRAETLAARGLVDAVVPPEQLRGQLRRVLSVLGTRPVPSRRRPPAGRPAPPPTPGTRCGAPAARTGPACASCWRPAPTSTCCSAHPVASAARCCALSRCSAAARPWWSASSAAGTARSPPPTCGPCGGPPGSPSSCGCRW
ncbi:hypothetical protein GCM10025734_67270 [Kitasatospora paranensis]